MQRTRKFSPVGSGQAAEVCPACEALADRDAQIVDELQSALVALTAVEGIDDDKVRLARGAAAVKAAMRLMHVRKW